MNSAPGVRLFDFFVTGWLAGPVELIHAVHRSFCPGESGWSFIESLWLILTGRSSFFLPLIWLLLLQLPHELE